MPSAPDILTACYHGKRVLVTGHTGFKGSWLTLWLGALGARVTGYALDPYTPLDNFLLSDCSRVATDVRGDIRDFENLQRVFREASPEFVFHLAAQPIVRESYQNPKETYDVNVQGTVNVLETCRLTDSVKAIVNVTSDKCYENMERKRGFKETDTLGGRDPYSSSKACSEIVTAAYRRSFFENPHLAGSGKALSSARAGNVLGGGDWQRDRLVPDCIRALLKNEPIKVRNPESIRPWQYVLEPLGGYLLLGARMAAAPANFSGAWNFGPEKSTMVSVRRLVELVIANWGRGEWVQADEKKNPHEARLLSLDISKAKSELGWQPSLDVAEAVKNTVDWYKQIEPAIIGAGIPDFCRAQIAAYMERMTVQ